MAADTASNPLVDTALQDPPSDPGTVIRQSPGVNLRVAADLLVEAVTALGDSAVSVVISSEHLTVTGRRPAEIAALIRRAADKYGLERDRLANQLKHDASLETVDADRRLAQWSEAGLRHEQSLLLLSYLRGSGQ